MIYDLRDRLILTQDGKPTECHGQCNQLLTFTKYDQFNRPILTGVKDTATSVMLSRVQMQAVVDAHFAKPLQRGADIYWYDKCK